MFGIASSDLLAMRPGVLFEILGRTRAGYRQLWMLFNLGWDEVELPEALGRNG